MNASVVVGLVWIAVVAGVASVVTAPRDHAVGVPPTRGPRSWLTRADGVVRRLPSVPGAVVVYCFGVLLTLAVSWVLGLVAHALEPAVDRPAFRWFAAHRVAWWDSLNNVLTQMGNGKETQLLTVVAAVVFAVWWRHGRWWAPPVVLFAAYAAERFGAQFLKVAVHRGHPPTTLGTWPSGGCARLVLIFGLVVFLYRRSRGLDVGRGARWYWVGVAVLAAIEANTRVSLLKHWFTDVVGGLLFGVMLLLVMMATFTVLTRGSRSPADRLPPAAGREPRREAAGTP